MLDLGWSEMAIIALVALLVLGPKELPNALRTVALWVRKARKLAREFQSGVDELVREAELEEAKKTVQSVSRVNVNREIEKTIDPTGDVSRALTSDPDDPKGAPKAAPAGFATDQAKPAAENEAAAPVAETPRGRAIERAAGDSPPQPASDQIEEAASSKSA